MGKQAKKKPPQGPKTKRAVYSYYAENLPDGNEAKVDRLNVVGQSGWKLLFFTGTTAWFVGDDNAVSPPQPEPHV
jgi:hypothetical protein